MRSLLHMIPFLGSEETSGPDSPATPEPAQNDQSLAFSGATSVSGPDDDQTSTADKVGWPPAPANANAFAQCAAPSAPAKMAQAAPTGGGIGAAVKKPDNFKPFRSDIYDSGVASGLLPILEDGESNGKGVDPDMIGRNRTAAPLRSMTVDGVIKLSRDSGNVAMGAYQITPGNLAGLRDHFQAGNKPFSEDMQNRMGLQMLIEAGLGDNLDGKKSLGAMILGVAKQFASEPKSASGVGFYDGDRYGNKAHGSYSALRDELINIKTE